MATNMDFRHRERTLQASPGFLQQAAKAGNAVAQHANGLNIGISVLRVSAMRVGWISRQAVIQKSLAREIIIPSQDIGCAAMFEKPMQLPLIDATVLQIAPQGMRPI